MTILFVEYRDSNICDMPSKTYNNVVAVYTGGGAAGSVPQVVGRVLKGRVVSWR